MTRTLVTPRFFCKADFFTRLREPMVGMMRRRLSVLPPHERTSTLLQRFSTTFSHNNGVNEKTSDTLQRQGFCVYPRRLVSESTCRALHERIPKLFAGDFETRVYPDEWHWRYYTCRCLELHYCTVLSFVILTVSSIPPLDKESVKRRE